MKKLIDKLENFEFQKGIDPQRLKVLQQLSIFMILNDDYQRIDLFNLSLDQITDNQLRSKIETFVISEHYKKLELLIETYNLDLKFSIASLLFLMNFIDDEKDLIIYLLYIKLVSNKKKINEINYYIMIKEFFPISTFKKEEIEFLWELQKENGEDLIYQKESWEPLNIK